MAIDGVQIIGSDSAHDIYNTVVENWRDGRPVSEIEADLRGWEKDFCYNPWETEIYWTALAFALWKIGHLPDDVRDRALQIIAQGACADWQKIDPQAQKQRQKALDALADKIRQPNPKPLARPKLPKNPRQPYFAEGDVLAVALPSGNYGACVLVNLDQTPRKTEYDFALVKYISPRPPTLDNVLQSAIAVRTGLGFDDSCCASHKTVQQVLPRLRRIGQIELSFSRMGGYYAVGPDDFFNPWSKLMKNQKVRPLQDFVKRVLDSQTAEKSSTQTPPAGPLFIHQQLGIQCPDWYVQALASLTPDDEGYYRLGGEVVLFGLDAFFVEMNQTQEVQKNLPGFVMVGYLVSAIAVFIRADGQLDSALYACHLGEQTFSAMSILATRWADWAQAGFDCESAYIPRHEYERVTSPDWIEKIRQAAITGFLQAQRQQVEQDQRSGALALKDALLQKRSLDDLLRRCEKP